MHAHPVPFAPVDDVATLTLHHSARNATTTSDATSAQMLHLKKRRALKRHALKLEAKQSELRASLASVSTALGSIASQLAYSKYLTARVKVNDTVAKSVLLVPMSEEVRS